MIQILGLVVALAVVLALAYVSLLVLKKIRPPGGVNGEELKFVTALAVGQRERLIVVSWRGDFLLLGIAGGGISLLHRLPISEAGSPFPPEMDITIGKLGGT